MAWQLQRKRVSTYGKTHPWLNTLPDGPVNEPKGYRGGLHFVTSPKDDMGHLIYPMSVQDTAKSGIGCCGNRCLHHLAERTSMNVGGSHMEMSSPSMKCASVGAAIVLGARESRVHGEGRQGIDIQWTK
jgi:hypothetical protein